MQIIVIALENLMRLEMDLDIQIARRPAIHTSLTFTGQTDAVALVNAGRDAYRQGFLFLDAPLTMTMGARIGNDLAAAVTARTSLLHREKALLHTHLTMSTASRAGSRFGTRLGAGAMAMLAFGQYRHADFGFSATRCFFQRDFQVVAQVGAR